MAELPTVVDALVATELAPSKGAARRTIKEGGAYVNNTKVATEDALLTSADLLHGRWVLLRRGKRNLGALELELRAGRAVAEPLPRAGRAPCELPAPGT
ncbi:hypothetical protein ACU686_01680 [Yinghuangia aomiensis]